jgi:hypothetical protein
MWKKIPVYFNQQNTHQTQDCVLLAVEIEEKMPIWQVVAGCRLQGTRCTLHPITKNY